MLQNASLEAKALSEEVLNIRNATRSHEARLLTFILPLLLLVNMDESKSVQDNACVMFVFSRVECRVVQ